MHNLLVFATHILLIGSLTLFSLRLGKEALIAWLCMLAIGMNLFVLKQMRFLGLEVTCSDALAVGYFLGLNLLQEFFGRPLAKRAVGIAFFISGCFLVLSLVHLLYLPSEADLFHSHFLALLLPLPRLLFASITSFLAVQCFDLSFFAFLRKKTSGRHLTLRTLLTLVLSELFDTLLFSFLGLYGQVAALSEIILFSLFVKTVTIVALSPFISLSKKSLPHGLSV